MNKVVGFKEFIGPGCCILISCLSAEGDNWLIKKSSQP